MQQTAPANGHMQFTERMENNKDISVYLSMIIAIFYFPILLNKSKYWMSKKAFLEKYFSMIQCIQLKINTLK